MKFFVSFTTLLILLVLDRGYANPDTSTLPPSTHESITNQLFQIIRGIVTEQQNFEQSVVSQLDDIKATQKLLDPLTFTERQTLQEIKTKVDQLSNTLVRLNLNRNGEGEFYPKMITLYKGKLHGDKWDVQLPTNPSTCMDIPTQATHKVSSIDTNGLCVILFKGRKCSERGIRFSEYSYGYDDFGKISFHDQVTSYRSC